MESERQTVLTLIAEACEQGARKAPACQLLGISVRSIQRWEKAETQRDRRLDVDREPANKLSEEEYQHIREAVNDPVYAALPPSKIVPLLASEGRYIASESTFYRLMKAEKLLTHRHKVRPGKKVNKPKALVATQPNEIYSWDITYLPTAVKGIFFYLYLMLDIFSRKIVGWQIHEAENSEHAANLLTDVCRREGIEEGQITLHSDNGSPMKGATMLATMEKLGVISSFSRPSVSNDNPYSESLFKTLKYRPEYPLEPFADLVKARASVEGFVGWYNNEHLHSGIKFVTPAQRHRGEDKAILARRHQVYLAARERHPLRWSGNTRNWDPIDEVHLNPNKSQSREQQIQRAG